MGQELEKHVQSLATMAKSLPMIEESNGSNGYKASWLTQFQAILWRSWLSVLKEPLLVKVRLIQTTVKIARNLMV